MKRLFKAFISGLIAFLLIFSLAAALSAFGGLFLLKSRLKSAQDVSEKTGVLTGTLVSYINSEFEKADRHFYVRLNAAMYEIVRDSRDRQDPYRIEEIFLIDKEGKLLAHSDITMLAKGSGADFTDESFTSAAYRPLRRPFGAQADRMLDWDGSYPEALYNFMKEKFPELLTERYHVGVAVYPVDSSVSRGSVHIYVHNTTFPQIIAKAKYYGFRAGAVIPGFSAFGGFLVFFFVLVFGGGSAARESSPVVRRTIGGIGSMPEGMEIYDVEAQPDYMDENYSTGYAEKSVIPDAIPVDDTYTGRNRHA